MKSNEINQETIKSSKISRRKALASWSATIAASSIIGYKISEFFYKPPSKENLEKLEKELFAEYSISDWQRSDLPDRPKINERLQEMAKKAGLENVQLYTYDGPDINAESATLIGMIASELGSKVSISNELLNLLTDDEVIAVLDHELGHHMHRVKCLAIDAAPAVANLGVAIAVYIGAFKSVDKLLPKTKNTMLPEKKEKFTRRNFLRAGLAGIPAIISTQVIKQAIVSSKISLINSRAGEFEADDESVNLSGDKASLISAFRKMKQWYLDHGYIPSDGLGTHPTLDKRIERINSR